MRSVLTATFSVWGIYEYYINRKSRSTSVKLFLDNRGKRYWFAFRSETSGCSGLAYVLEFVDVLNEEDQVFEQHGVNIIVDPKSLVYLNGIELDYVKEGLK